jgi:hypothetical protein
LERVSLEIEMELVENGRGRHVGVVVRDKEAGAHGAEGRS